MGGKLKQSRVDHCLISSGTIKELANISYKFNNWSDHASLEMQFGQANRVGGGGLWCLNTSLLEDEAFNKKMRALLSNMQVELDNNNYIDDWNRLKIKI